MKRRLATALITAALLAVSVTAGAGAGAQTEQVPERTGERAKDVQVSCPVHPEIKARFGRCPKCRAEERKMKGARERDKSKVSRRQPQEGAAAND